MYALTADHCVALLHKEGEYYYYHTFIITATVL
jgi:hypothetical protein